MKKICAIAVMAVLFIGCRKDVTSIAQVQPQSELAIASTVGIKLQSAFVTTEVAMNVKIDAAQTATVKISDITGRVVSKETINLKTGDNIVKVYTSALPSSAYRIALYDSNNNMLAITDFNKI
jgi:PBP1b-binding outer membrane lipoprotein LpoB